MISLIIGNKGSGKTKKLIELVNGAAEKSNGNVVCIEKGPGLTYDVTHKVRLINSEVYGISNFTQLLGFLSGICAGNYDVTDIMVDATFRIGGRDYNELADFLQKVDELSRLSETHFLFTLSCDESELPARIFDFSQKI